jgi:hypothetical protein
MIRCDFLPSLGTREDMILLSGSAHVSLIKKPITIESSPHLDFDRDTTAFRLVMRIDGTQIYANPLIFKGGASTSPFIILN